MLLAPGAAVGFQVDEVLEVGLVVLLQTVWVVVDDLLHQQRPVVGRGVVALLHEPDQLVDLLLVLGDNN
ncbi:MAG TPA: hypothetical protein PLX71_08955, partial [Phycicoccus sp.]|nr:hypothetical protein [Phycicoccus sp.]